MGDAWQPISTAPKDGTHVLLAIRGEKRTVLNWRGKRVVAGYFQAQGHDWMVEGNWAKLNGVKPTHWLPLPSPPSMKDEGHG